MIDVLIYTKNIFIQGKKKHVSEAGSDAAPDTADGSGSQGEVGDEDEGESSHPKTVNSYLLIFSNLICKSLQITLEN